MKEFLIFVAPFLVLFATIFSPFGLHYKMDIKIKVRPAEKYSRGLIFSIDLYVTLRCMVFLKGGVTNGIHDSKISSVGGH